MPRPAPHSSDLSDSHLLLSQPPFCYAKATSDFNPQTIQGTTASLLSRSHWGGERLNLFFHYRRSGLPGRALHCCCLQVRDRSGHQPATGRHVNGHSEGPGKAPAQRRASVTASSAAEFSAQLRAVQPPEVWLQSPGVSRAACLSTAFGSKFSWFHIQPREMVSVSLSGQPGCLDTHVIAPGDPGRFWELNPGPLPPAVTSISQGCRH